MIDGGKLEKFGDPLLMIQERLYCNLKDLQKVEVKK